MRRPHKVGRTDRQIAASLLLPIRSTSGVGTVSHQRRDSRGCRTAAAALGNGAGKSRLTVASDAPVTVMSLLESATGPHQPLSRRSQLTRTGNAGVPPASRAESRAPTRPPNRLPRPPRPARARQDPAACPNQTASPNHAARMGAPESSNPRLGHRGLDKHHAVPQERGPGGAAPAADQPAANPTAPPSCPRHWERGPSARMRARRPRSRCAPTNSLSRAQSKPGNGRDIVQAMASQAPSHAEGPSRTTPPA